MTRAVCLLAVLAVLGGLARLPSRAHGATGQPGFSVAAAGFSSYFRYSLEPGRHARGALRLVSQSGRTIHVLIQGVDVGTAATGGLAYGASESDAVDRLLTLSRHGVRLDAGTTVEVPFGVAVSRALGPGDHFAGIVALNRAQVRAARRGSRRKGFSLRFLPRLAIAVQVTVPGQATHVLQFGNAGIDVTPSSTDVTLLLRNSGNKLIKRTGGRLAVSQNGRVLVRRGVALDAFVPGTTLLYRIPLVGRPAEGSYSVRGILRPERGAPVPVDATVSFGAAAAREFKRETGREATSSGPSTLLVAGLIGASVVVLVLLGALLRTRRRLRALRGDDTSMRDRP